MDIRSIKQVPGGRTLKEISEERLLTALLGRESPSKHLVVGPGDDCAVVKIPGSKELLLLKADSVVCGIHFTKELDPAKAGRKALCRPLSDIAAMGGKPLHALVSIFSPPGESLEYWQRFYRGLMKEARLRGVSLAGGEMSSSSCIAASVAVTGCVEKSALVKRSGGKAGDWLFVTGKLGGSIRRKHWAFEPRLAEGRWLGKGGYAMAMMDLSDGLAGDLPRLAAASRCGYQLDWEKIPRTPGCTLEQAVGDGEDYELLFAVPPDRAARLERQWRSKFPKLPLTNIGRLCRAGEGERFPADGYQQFLAKPVAGKNDPVGND